MGDTISSYSNQNDRDLYLELNEEFIDYFPDDASTINQSNLDLLDISQEQDDGAKIEHESQPNNNKQDTSGQQLKKRCEYGQGPEAERLRKNPYSNAPYKHLSAYIELQKMFSMKNKKLTFSEGKKILHEQLKGKRDNKRKSNCFWCHVHDNYGIYKHLFQEYLIS